MAKRWTIPFVSRQSKQCRIDIDDPGYTGTVTELSTTNADAPGVPAADPFYFEEDDDEDLLKVVRIKTGYINLIETVQDGLIDLYPIYRKSRYVEVYYDDELVFRGYIQLQSFDNDWCAPPREVSLPVISPLGLLDDFDVSLPSTTPLTDKTLGYYMKQLIDAIDSSQHTPYDSVVFPQVSDCPDFAGTIRPTVLWEDNPEFAQAWVNVKQPYKGVPFRNFLEGICNAYGWICHDMPDCILFTKFDHDDASSSGKKYYYYSISNLETASNRQTLQDEYAYPLVLSDYVEPCADDGTISQIMPYKLITANFKGDITKRANAVYSHMQCSRVFTYKHDGNEEYIVFLKNVVGNPMPDISSSNLLDSNTVYESDNRQWLQDDGVCVFDQNGTIRMVMKNMWNWASYGDTVATLYFFNRPILTSDVAYTDMKLLVEVSVSDNINDFGPHEILYDLTYELWSGETLVGSQRVFYNSDNYSVTLSYNNVPNTGALRLVIKNTLNSTLHSRYPLLSFDKIELYYQEETYGKYLSTSNKRTIVGDYVGGAEDANVDMLMSCQRQPGVKLFLYELPVFADQPKPPAGESTSEFGSVTAYDDVIHQPHTVLAHGMAVATHRALIPPMGRRVDANHASFINY